jgi:hypothetical protein
MFCCLQCKDEAKTVRYARRKNAEYPDGMPDDIEYAIKIRVAHALSGGYDAVARTLTAATREAVFQRGGGTCVTCGAPGEEIDHIDGPSSDLSNLRLLCAGCHHTVTAQHLTPATDTQAVERLEALLARIDAPVPTRVCDHERTWASQWRAWRTAHATFE